jgi:hypothetical protein
MMEKSIKYVIAFVAFLVFGGLVALGVFSAKDKYVAYQAEQKLKTEQQEATYAKCQELAKEVVKYIEANREDEKLKEADASEALQFIVKDEQDAWGNKYQLAIQDDAVIVSSPGPTDSEDDNVEAFWPVTLPKKSVFDRVKGLFR